MSWTERVARVWEKVGAHAHTRFWWGFWIERDNLEDLRVDGRILLK